MTVVHFRPPLDYHEVPLPPGGNFTHDLLRLEFKAELRAEHEFRVRETTERRVLMYDKAVRDRDYRRLLYEMCARDPEFFIDHFVCTYDDRVSRIEPMVLFPVQRDKIVRPYLEMVNTEAPRRYTGMVAKSRAMGWSWVSMALRAWAFLFKNNWSILIGGEQRDDVDDGGQNATQQSLFGKIRFILNHLPDWMREDLLGPMYLKDEFNKRMLIRNPLRPLNILVGKQLGAMFGRGPRFSEVFADEVAWAAEMEDADTALKQTTNRFLGGSTPRGMIGFFPQMMFGDLAIHRYWLWWAEHPYLGLDWYNEQRQAMLDEQIAQELDISFEKSLGGRVITGIASVDDFFTDLAEYDEHLPLQIWIDPGWADNMAALWIQEDEARGEIRIVDVVETRKERIDWLVPFITGFIPELDSRGQPWPHHYNEIEKEIIARHQLWNAPAEVLGDYAGGAKSPNTGTSCWDELEAYGIYVEGVKMPPNEIALEHMNLWLRHVRAAARLRDQRNGPPATSATLLEVITMWRYPQRRDGGPRTSLKPVHDKHCHIGDCLKMALWDRPLPDPKVQDVRLRRTIERDPRRRSDPGYHNPFRS